MPSFSWDNRALRYRGDGGRFVRREAIASALDAAIAETQERLENVSSRLQRGEINLSQWVIECRDLIKANHLLAGGIARGGKMQLSPASLGQIGSITKLQYEKLAAFGREIEKGYPINSKRFLNRIGLYAKAGWGTFVESERRMHRDAGFTLEQNVLNSIETCTKSPSCVGETAKGEVPIGTLIPVGQRACYSNCRCQLIFKRAA